MTTDPQPGPAVEPRTDVPLGRRLLLGLVPVMSLALVAAACTGARTGASPSPSAGARVPTLGAGVRGQVAGGRLALGGGYAFDTLTQPLEITSRNRVLDVTLAAVWQNLFVPDTPQGSNMNLRTWQVVSINGVPYNGPQAFGFPGPTLRAYPGDSIHILLQNRLGSADTNSRCMNYPAADTLANPTPPPDTTWLPQDTMQNCFHGPNWTNIHYHGMHVTPDSVGDDVLLLIAPGQTHEYGFRIPFNQSAGTHWYHPHKHGSVAIQVMNGMTGALIVDGGPLDSLADRSGMVEKVIAMQQIDSLPNLIDAPDTAGPSLSPPLTLINGKISPVIVMRPGEVQRWRLVDENVTKTAAFRVGFVNAPGQEPAMYDVARDGVAYANVNYAPDGVMTPDTAVLLAPGNRLDVFVQAPMAGGLYQLQGTPINHDISSDSTRKPGLADDRDPRTVRGRRAALGAGATGTTPLFYVYVDASLPPNGSTLPPALPPLPSFLANLPGTLDTAAIRRDSANLAVVVFAQQASTRNSRRQVASPTQFFLGTQRTPLMQFNDTVVYVPRNSMNQPMPMVLDSVQTWKVVNNTGIPHPFHIHINPFQVLGVYYPNGANDPNAALFAQLNTAAQVNNSPIWLDVIPLPTNGYIYIRQGYEPFRNADGSICQNCGPAYGEFVMHCHILGHEERGMMQLIEIVPSASMMQGGAGGSGGHAHSSGHSHAAPPAQQPGGHSHH
jgi:L-ascorbate oxidase